jgi:acetaldehyde dehydrogenase/alcohol dehydrogenase
MTSFAPEPPAGPPAGPQAEQILGQAVWAGYAYARYDIESVRRIVAAVAKAALDQAEHFARWAVLESGSGVVDDKAGKNLVAANNSIDTDFVSAHANAVNHTVHLPRPRGVLVGLIPANSPISTLYRQILLSLLTRNALVLSPDARVAGCASAAARMLAEVAVEAGAPDGVIQIAEPSDAVRSALTGDPRVGMVLGSVGRSANVPALVDASADLERAARKLFGSQVFDNSLLTGCESVLIVEREVAVSLLVHLQLNGAHLLEPDDVDRVRALLFPGGGFAPELIGKDAQTIADRAGVRIPADARMLLAPLERASAEEPLAYPKPCPVLGFVPVRDALKGIRTAAGVLRLGTDAHSAVIHSNNPQTVLDYSAALPVRQITVNESGGAGSVGRDIQIGDLITWTHITHYGPLPGVHELTPWQAFDGPVPGYPLAGNLPPAP